MDTEKIETGKKWRLPSVNLPRGVIIAICSLPVVLIGAYYALRLTPSVMGWVSLRVSTPIRRVLGMLSSIYPFSITEILIFVAIVWIIFYIIKTITVTARRRGKLRILARRLLPVVVAAAYIWSLFCWLWNSGYYAPGFAERHGFSSNGVAISDLAFVTSMFAERANILASLVPRDEDGRYIADRRGVFAASTGIYSNIASEFPDLGGRTFAPKSMMFSWLMSRTGYTGVYFALTGEANINTHMPAPFLPATVAHEHAHQLGVFAEDEADFVSIVACVTSGNAIFEYSGYIRGLGYLLSALHSDDPQSWMQIAASLSDEVWNDWRDSDDYWESQRKVEIGVGFLDKFLTNVTQGMSDTVDAVYDGFLKSQNQTLGIRSYGACVDLLVEYFIARADS